MNNIKFSWLGPPIIECNHLALHLETRKAIALLAFLNLSTNPPSRENLATLFWPEFDQIHALANLRRALFSINQSLGPEIVLANRDTIRTNPDTPVWQDISEFHLLLANVTSHQHNDFTLCPECINRLENASTLYRGNFLDGINLRDCPEFDDWQYLQREAYQGELASCLEKLALVFVSLEEWEKAVLYSRRWVSLDRLNEKAQRMLIQIYAMSGQRSAAITQYDECVRWLKDELDQSPEAETVELYQKIRSGQYEKTGAASNITLAPAATPVISQPLIKTKLFIPRPPSTGIARPQLFTKLDQGAGCALTLISAPAGYGKTTILSEWIETHQSPNLSSTPRTVAWLSLDAGDNDPIRFLTYLTAALAKVNPAIGGEARSLLQSSQRLQTQTPLSILINDLQEVSQSISLILDDYQFINNPDIHQGIHFFLEHIPDNFHVVISTRSDPPLPLARLRGRNQLVEIRAKDLRFTPEEAAEFLRTAFDLRLTSEQITALENRTEGWIAGLQMAAISMQGRGDISNFIEVFSGSHRFIMDYLAEEALLRQPIETQKFLLRTSFLERLSQPLCDYVIAEHSTAFHNDTPGLLNELEQSNLFIIPLDDERIWYRYHHLFADLLQTRLKQTSPELIPILHARASAWFDQNGLSEEAINHSFAAKDWEGASRLVERHAQAYLDRGQMATVIKWFGDLPQEIIYQNPMLCVKVAEVYSQAGRIDQIDPYLNKAEESLSAETPPGGDFPRFAARDLSQQDTILIQAMVPTLRGLKSVCSGDPKRALDLTQTALAGIPGMQPKELAVLFWVEGWAYRSLGNLADAISSFTRATEYARVSGANLHDVWTDLAVATQLVGKLPQAIEIFTNSLKLAADRGVQNQGILSRDEAFLSLILLEQNQLDLALTHADRALAYTQWWPSHNIIAIADASLAQIWLARGDLDESLCAAQKADEDRKNRLMTPYVHSLVDVTLVRVWMARGDWDQIDEWSKSVMAAVDLTAEKKNNFDQFEEMRLLMVVRVWIEKARIDQKVKRDEDCLRLINRLESSSRATGRINSLVEGLWLKAIVLHSQSNLNEAFVALDECLSFAGPGGYMRIFLATGEPAYPLLAAYLRQPSPTYQPYALKILKEFGRQHPSADSSPSVVEPITPREMDILQLLVKGCSNRQIAEKLMLSEGTVKFHVHNLLEKLQVESRTQAIARAKDLDLIR